MPVIGGKGHQEQLALMISAHSVGPDGGIVEAKLGHHLQFHIKDGQASAPFCRVNISIIRPQSCRLVQIFVKIGQQLPILGE